MSAPLKSVVNNRGGLFWTLVSLGGLLFAFLTIPILNFFVLDPLDSVFNKLGDSQVRSAIGVSLGTASITTGVALFLATPLAYLLARQNFRGKSIVESVIDAPILIPHSISGLMVLSAFGASGVFQVFFGYPKDLFVGELAGIIVAQLFVSAPFMVKLSREGFEAIDPKLEYTARTLGASPSKTFFTVTLPLSGRAILTGALMTWARAVSEFGAVLFIAYTPYSIPTLMYYRFNGWGLQATRPIAILFLLICVWVFVAVRLLKRNPLKRLIEV